MKRLFKQLSRRKIVTFTLMLVIFVMSLGYAALSQYIEIEGLAMIDRSWIIAITNVESSVTGAAVNKSSPYVGSTVTMNATIPNNSSTVTYTITLKNEGNLKAKLHSIEKIEDNNTSVSYTISGVEEGVTTLNPGETNTAIVTIKVKDGITSISDTEKSVMLSFYYVEDSTNQGDSGSTTAAVFNKETPAELTFTSQEDISTFQEVKVDNVTVDSSNYTLTSGSTIVTLKKEYLNTLNSGTHTMNIVSSNNTVSTTFEVTTTKTSTSLVETILSNNEVYADNVPSKYVTGVQGIDFASISSDTNGKGLYYTSTNTEDNKPTYYFRGEVDNNYVKLGQVTVTMSGNCTYNGTNLTIYNATDQNVTIEQCLSLCIVKHKYTGSYYLDSCSFTSMPLLEYVDGTPTYTEGKATAHDMYWRIIRINEDGSIRLIYNGTSSTATGSDVTIENTYYNEEPANGSSSLLGDNAHVGYMYGLVGQSGDNAYKLTHSNDNSSMIKTYIDNWYTNSTNLSNYKDSYLADAGFCNDRSVAPSAGLWSSVDTALGYDTNHTYYGALNRIKKAYQPQFACPNASNDLFTTSSSSKGNKALSNPIGLLTADEVAYAGGIYGKKNNSYYLYANIYYWTMSPDSFDGNITREWIVGDDGSAGTWHVGSGLLAVRPVINLNYTVELSDELPSGCTEQNGTASCPYIIDTN